eukprot:1165973-Pleurochrysis_carterae.AAC.1
MSAAAPAARSRREVGGARCWARKCRTSKVAESATRGDILARLARRATLYGDTVAQPSDSAAQDWCSTQEATFPH